MDARGSNSQTGPTTRGRITQLSPGRMCGTIRASHGQSVFFHGRDLEGATYKDLKLGGVVSFELIDDRISGPRAARVRVIGLAKARAGQ